jgi:hypothetical protein
MDKVELSVLHLGRGVSFRILECRAEGDVQGYGLLAALLR